MTVETKLLLADSYDAAADYLETYGWARGSLYDGPQINAGTSGKEIVESTMRHFNTNHPAACLMGAAYAVGIPCVGYHDDVLPDDLRTRYEVLNWTSWSIPLRDQLGGEDVIAFNDSVAENVDEVIDLLRVTAQKIRVSVDG